MVHESFNQSISGYRKYIELEAKKQNKIKNTPKKNLIQSTNQFDHQWKMMMMIMVDDLFDDILQIITIDDDLVEENLKFSFTFYIFLFIFTKADISSNDLNNFCCFLNRK